MKRRFAVPAAIALTAHALLFMGYGRPPVPPPPACVVLPPDERPQQVELTPEPAAPSGDEGESTSSIVKFEGPPVVPEPPPVTAPSDQTITQVWEKEINGTATKLTPFNLGLNRRDHSHTDAVTVSMLDDKPRTRFQKSPVYPRTLKNAGETGTVWVEFVVDERGYVHDARVVKSSNSGFDEVTLAAVSEWRFEPGKRKGIPVRFRMSLPLVFDITR